MPKRAFGDPSPGRHGQTTRKQWFMEYTKLGRSSMTVSKICLGTMHFGPKATEEESHQILDKAVEMGINFIDTANVYGGEAGRGRSEEIIGNW